MKSKLGLFRGHTVTRNCLIVSCLWFALTGCDMEKEKTSETARFAVNTTTPCEELQSWEGNDWRLSFSEGETIEHNGDRYVANVNISYPNGECAPDNPVLWCVDWFSYVGPCDQGPTPTCDDGIMNQDETGVDCGGVCPACDGDPCQSGDECISGVCTDGVCVSACVNGETLSCGSDVGQCVAGVQTCVDGQWSDCEGAILPGIEVCDANGLDENCDGQANEGCECTSDADCPGGVCNAGVCEETTPTCDNCMVPATYSFVFSNGVSASPFVCDAPAEFNPSDGSVVIPIVSISVTNIPESSPRQHFSSYTVTDNTVTVNVSNADGDEVLVNGVNLNGWSGVQVRVDILWTARLPEPQ